MASTAVSVLLTSLEEVEKKRELDWDRYLVGLRPWEFHRLTCDGLELTLHDKFVAGHVSLYDVQVIVAGFH